MSEGVENGCDSSFGAAFTDGVAEVFVGIGELVIKQVAKGVEILFEREVLTVASTCRASSG